MASEITIRPYSNALRPGAPYKGEEILRDLKTIMQDFKPTKVFVSHPADYNVDHQALYLFTRVALWDLQASCRPKLYPYLVHFPHWPLPQGEHPDQPLNPPLPLAGQIPWLALTLGRQDVAFKLAALQAHKTQYEYSPRYLSSFVRSREIFGDFPDVHCADTNMVAGHATGDGAELLTDEERASFVGVEWRRVGWDDDAFSITIEISRPLAETVSASVHACGYRADQAFGQEPKLYIKIGALDHDVYDQKRRLPDASVTVTRQRREISVRIPLRALGNPERVLTSARTYLGDVPLDTVAWRVVELGSHPKAAGQTPDQPARP